jgi:5-methylcytosine-specific restriction endonuclease McrA
MRIYRSGNRYKATIDTYRKSEHGRIIVRQCNKIYKQSEKGRSTNRRYQKSNKGLAYQRYQMQRRRDPNASLTPGQILEVLMKFEQMCFVCGSNIALCIDHHKPLNAGFGLVIDNAVVLCKRCNSSKCDRMPQDFYTTAQLIVLENQYGITSS